MKVLFVPPSLWISTWINDGIILIEGNSGVPSFPLRPLDFQVALLDGQEGDALVVSSVEFCQVLAEHGHQRNRY